MSNTHTFSRKKYKFHPRIWTTRECRTGTRRAPAGRQLEGGWSSSKRVLSLADSEGAGSSRLLSLQTPAGSLRPLCRHAASRRSTRANPFTHTAIPPGTGPQRSAAFGLSPHAFRPWGRAEPAHRAAAQEAALQQRSPPGRRGASRGEPRRPAERSRSHLFVLQQDVGQSAPEPHRLPGRGADELVPSQHGHGPAPERRRSRVSARRPPPVRPQQRGPLPGGRAGAAPRPAAPTPAPAHTHPSPPPPSALPCGGGSALSASGAGAAPHRAPRTPAARAATCRAGAEGAAGPPEAGSARSAPRTAERSGGEGRGCSAPAGGAAGAPQGRFGLVLTRGVAAARTARGYRWAAPPSGRRCRLTPPRAAERQLEEHERNRHFLWLPRFCPLPAVGFSVPSISHAYLSA